MIINLPMKSYRSLSILPKLILCATTFAALTTPSFANEKKAPPPKPANQYAAFDAHPNEHVTVAAEPCDDIKDCDFFRLPYVSHSLLPVRVIFTNDSDSPLTLDDVRIQFISVNNDKIPAATDEDINRRLFSTHSAMGTKVPVVPITIHHPPVDKKITRRRERLRLHNHHRQTAQHPRRLSLLRHPPPKRPPPQRRRTLHQDGLHRPRQERRKEAALRLQHPLRQMARREPLRQLLVAG